MVGPPPCGCRFAFERPTCSIRPGTTSGSDESNLDQLAVRLRSTERWHGSRTPAARGNWAVGAVVPRSLILLVVALSRAAPPPRCTRAQFGSDLAPPIQPMIGERGPDRASPGVATSPKCARATARACATAISTRSLRRAAVVRAFTQASIDRAGGGREVVRRDRQRDSGRRAGSICSASCGRARARRRRGTHGSPYFRDASPKRERAWAGINAAVPSARRARARDAFTARQQNLAAAADAYQRRGLSTDTSVEAGLPRVSGTGVTAIALGCPSCVIQARASVVASMVWDPRAAHRRLVDAGDPHGAGSALVPIAEPPRHGSSRHWPIARLLRVPRASTSNPGVTDWIERSRGTRPRLCRSSAASPSATAMRFSTTDRRGASFIASARTRRALRAGQRWRQARARGSRPPDVSGPQRDPDRAPGSPTSSPGRHRGHRCRTAATERFRSRGDHRRVFPYLSDRDLHALAMREHRRCMLAPGLAHLPHNEPRPLLGEAMHALGLPLIPLTHCRDCERRRRDVTALRLGVASPHP